MNYDWYNIGISNFITKPFVFSILEWNFWLFTSVIQINKIIYGFKMNEIYIKILLYIKLNICNSNVFVDIIEIYLNYTYWYI